MSELTAGALLERYFWPHYPPDARADLDAARTTNANPGNNPAVIAHLAEAAEIMMARAPELLGTPLDGSPEGVHRLSRALDRTLRDKLLASSRADDPTNPFFNLVIHATAYLGEVIVRRFDGRWSIRRPLWESTVQRRLPGGKNTDDSGAIAPFHWLLKHLSDAEIDHGSLAHRFRVHVELATADLAALPIFVEPRTLPALRSPTYDLLVKYLRAHVPALRDLGAGFLSPAEFTARRYSQLNFQAMEAGRVLALHGQSSADGDRPPRAEVHWFTARGFDHTEAFPCDADPSYMARTVDPLLEVTVVWNGAAHTHRTTFRGHV